MVNKNNLQINEGLYSYFFHFNPFTGYWNAVPRDKAVEYLNGTLKPDDVLKNRIIGDLIEYLSKNE